MRRPSVLKGDRIKLHPHSVGDGVWFKGIVQEVRAASVLIMFHNSFPYEPSALYDVQFVLNPVPFRRMLQALKVHPKRPDVLFPRPDDMRANHDTAQPSNDHEMELYNHLLNSNAEQLQAVKKVTELPPGSPPFIIFGP
jgi:helicase MOV-10